MRRERCGIPEFGSSSFAAMASKLWDAMFVVRAARKLRASFACPLSGNSWGSSSYAVDVGGVSYSRCIGRKASVAVASGLQLYFGGRKFKLKSKKESRGCGAWVFIKIVKVEKARVVVLQSRPACAGWAVNRDLKL